MGTDIRPEITDKSKYYLPKHRYYELLHFCRQYSDYKSKYKELEEASLKSINYEAVANGEVNDIVQDVAIKLDRINNKVLLIDKTCERADPDLSDYILMAVTKGVSYENLSTVHNIPCSRNTFYDRYRRFFWLLDKERE